MTTKVILTNKEIMEAAEKVALHLRSKGCRTIYGIPRGGVPTALAIAAASERSLEVVDSPDMADAIVDDLIDSGTTLLRYFANESLRSKEFAVLFSKQQFMPIMVFASKLYGKEDWLVFPWESSDQSDYSVTDSVIRMLQYIGEDPNREGLKETPRRVVSAWEEWFSGYGMNEADVYKVFEDGGELYDEMVLLTDIPVFSHCEHHVTPFIGVAHVAYIPDKKIVGLSKLARVVDLFARRLQVQERLTTQIANSIDSNLNPLGVAVVVKAKHFCMCTRGVKTPGVDTTTSCMTGVFRDKPEARAEFMGLLPK